ncbi:MutS-related protein [Klebsiella pneumoniae]|uniref:MutS-related protein n=1 Tax=Klebsiella pneumoniae TaxID=573 RepID=UPI003EE01DA8
MNFISILFATLDESRRHKINTCQPEYFVDLNLDKVVMAIVKGREEYDISPFFYTLLEYPEDIYYRQGVIQDVAKNDLYNALVEYSTTMMKIREIGSRKENRYYHYQQRRWELECVLLYCHAVIVLHERLEAISFTSCGMTNFRNYLSDYINSDGFTDLSTIAQTIRKQLEDIRYSLRIKGDTISVEHYADEINYSNEVLQVFSRFKQHDVQVDVDFRSHDGNMNNLESRILDCVAKLFPAVFAGLDAFIEAHSDYQEHTLKVFEREIQFYLASIHFIRQFQVAGLTFCIPEVNREKKDITVTAAFDLALADSLLNKQTPVVCNDFYLHGRERILVISGPNQGGKTTFARMVGQLHYFALLGLYVPAQQANLYLVDNIYTHFEKSENIHNLRGKLYDDLVRIKAIINQSTARSLIIMNEIFTSTTSHDAIYLGTRVIEKVIALDALCVCVTFIDELTAPDPSVVSMMSTVEENNEAARTYKIIRKPADGMTWSATLVQKYGLTYEKIKAGLNG